LDPKLNARNRWPANMNVPYKVLLADGRSIFAPEDSDFVIRKVAPQQNNLANRDGEEESEESVHPEVKRFRIGDRVECKTDSPSHEWCAGLIKATDVCDDETNRRLGWPPGTVVPYEVELESGANFLVRQDSQDLVRAYKTPPTPPAADSDSDLEAKEDEEESEALSEPEDDKEEPQERQVFEIFESKAPQIEPTNISRAEELSERRCAEPEPLPQEALASPPDDLIAVAVVAGGGPVLFPDENEERTPLRFSVGDEVECWFGQHSSQSKWMRGEVTEVSIDDEEVNMDNDFPAQTVLPYKVFLEETGGNLFIQADSEDLIRAASLGEARNSDSNADSSDEGHEQGHEELESMALPDHAPAPASPASSSSSLFGFMSLFGIKACCDTRPGGPPQGGTEELVVVKPPEKPPNDNEESTEDVPQEEIKPSGKWLK